MTQARGRQRLNMLVIYRRDGALAIPGLSSLQVHLFFLLFLTTESGKRSFPLPRRIVLVHAGSHRSATVSPPSFVSLHLSLTRMFQQKVDTRAIDTPHASHAPPTPSLTASTTCPHPTTLFPLLILFQFPPRVRFLFFKSLPLPTGGSPSAVTEHRRLLKNLQLVGIILHQVSGIMKQLRPSQIDREHLIREVGINRHQCGARHS